MNYPQPGFLFAHVIGGLGPRLGGWDETQDRRRCHRHCAVCPNRYPPAHDPYNRHRRRRHVHGHRGLLLRRTHHHRQGRDHPGDQSDGVLAGIALAAERLGLTPARLLGETVAIVHGTTVATNALLEGKAARVGMLTTAGHRDIIEMREGLKPERYNLRMAPPEPLVPGACGFRCRSGCARMGRSR